LLFLKLKGAVAQVVFCSSLARARRTPPQQPPGRRRYEKALGSDFQIATESLNI
jgi:hypothetical protein